MCRLICARTWYRVLKAPMCEHAPEAMANANLPTMATAAMMPYWIAAPASAFPSMRNSSTWYTMTNGTKEHRALITLNSADSAR